MFLGRGAFWGQEWDGGGKWPVAVMRGWLSKWAGAGGGAVI